MFFGGRLLSLVVFFLTVGWAVMGQDIFGREHIQKIGHELAHKVSDKIQIVSINKNKDIVWNNKEVAEKTTSVYQSSYFVTASYPMIEYHSKP